MEKCTGYSKIDTILKTSIFRLKTENKKIGIRKKLNADGMVKDLSNVMRKTK